MVLFPRSVGEMTRIVRLWLWMNMSDHLACVCVCGLVTWIKLGHLRDRTAKYDLFEKYGQILDLVVFCR